MYVILGHATAPNHLHGRQRINNKCTSVCVCVCEWGCVYSQMDMMMMVMPQRRLLIADESVIYYSLRALDIEYTCCAIVMYVVYIDCT